MELGLSGTHGTLFTCSQLNCFIGFMTHLWTVYVISLAAEPAARDLGWTSGASTSTVPKMLPVFWLLLLLKVWKSIKAFMQITVSGHRKKHYCLFCCPQEGIPSRAVNSACDNDRSFVFDVAAPMQARLLPEILFLSFLIILHPRLVYTTRSQFSFRQTQEFLPKKSWRRCS